MSALIAGRAMIRFFSSACGIIFSGSRSKMFRKPFFWVEPWTTLSWLLTAGLSRRRTQFNYGRCLRLLHGRTSSERNIPWISQHSAKSRFPWIGLVARTFVMILSFRNCKTKLTSFLCHLQPVRSTGKKLFIFHPISLRISQKICWWQYTCQSH